MAWNKKIISLLAVIAFVLFLGSCNRNFFPSVGLYEGNGDSILFVKEFPDSITSNLKWYDAFAEYDSVGYSYVLLDTISNELYFPEDTATIWTDSLYSDALDLEIIDTKTEVLQDTLPEEETQTLKDSSVYLIYTELKKIRQIMEAKQAKDTLPLQKDTLSYDTIDTHKVAVELDENKNPTDSTATKISSKELATHDSIKAIPPDTVYILREKIVYVDTAFNNAQLRNDSLNVAKKAEKKDAKSEDKVAVHDTVIVRETAPQQEINVNANDEKERLDSLVNKYNELVNQNMDKMGTLSDSIEALKKQIAEAKTKVEYKEVVLTKTVNNYDTLHIVATYNVNQTAANNYTQIIKQFNAINWSRVKSVSLSGYTDASGSFQINKKLTDQRIEKLRDIVVQRGISERNIFIQNFSNKYASKTVIEQERKVDISIVKEKQ